MSSRSFAVVIKNLSGDLARYICLFYLVLRGLDTVEDDMTLPVETKQKLLREFYTHLTEPGWRFTGSGPNEKDREVLINFDQIIAELGNIPKPVFDIIADICQKMGKGMADFCDRVSEGRSFWVETIEEYDLYCHYVAGVLGEGLSRLFAASGKEQEYVADQLEISNSCGLLLQKTNITRDYREDVDEGRFFWPREIWGQYGFADLKELYDPARERDAVWALNAMVLDALRHSVDALDYLTMLKNQSVFNFVAVPDVMAMATLALVFGNKDVLKKNVKIRRGQTVLLMEQATNPRDVAYLFRDFARAIHKKLMPADPNYVKVSVMCGRIEQWCEHHYPSFILMMSQGEGKGVSTSVDTGGADARIRIYQARKTKEEEKKRIDRLVKYGLDPAKLNEKPGDDDDSRPPWWLLAAMLGVTILLFAVTAAIAFGALWFFDLLK